MITSGLSIEPDALVTLSGCAARKNENRPSWATVLGQVVQPPEFSEGPAQTRDRDLVEWKDAGSVILERHDVDAQLSTAMAATSCSWHYCATRQDSPGSTVNQPSWRWAKSSMSYQCPR